ncbi:hypothetical protein CW304_13525 [Bacillus sp. UFRGS-B20]|nr:hypothetical protein CW304_13525 [Bacillus sp. UFRGS-B20]
MNTPLIPNLVSILSDGVFDTHLRESRLLAYFPLPGAPYLNSHFSKLNLPSVFRFFNGLLYSHLLPRLALLI